MACQIRDYSVTATGCQMCWNWKVSDTVVGNFNLINNFFIPTSLISHAVHSKNVIKNFTGYTELLETLMFASAKGAIRWDNFLRQRRNSKSKLCRKVAAVSGDVVRWVNILIVGIANLRGFAGWRAPAWTDLCLNLTNRQRQSAIEINKP